MRYFFLILSLVLVFTIGCGDDSTGGGTEYTCSPEEPTGTCEPGKVCDNGQCISESCTDGNTQACTCDGGESGTQTCTNGNWGSCECQSGCSNGSTQACTCDGGESGTQTCTDGNWGSCQCESGCTDGSTQACTCNSGESGTQTCTDGNWESCQCESVDPTAGLECSDNSVCGDGVCDTNYPGGYCTQSCTTSFEQCLGNGVCIVGADGGSCFRTCTAGDDHSCERGDYVCETINNDGLSVCIPRCTNDTECSNNGSLVCDTDTGHCIAAQGTQNIGDPCGSTETGNCVEEATCVLQEQGATEGTCLQNCDINNSDCPEGEQCTELNNGGAVCYPGANGDRQIGETCGQEIGACVSGATCTLMEEGATEGLCLQNCDPDADPSDCSDGYGCAELSNGSGVCIESSEDCTMVSNEGCSPTEQCWMTQAGGTSCFPAGDIAVGEACSSSNTSFVCEPGSYCYNGTCKALCSVDVTCSAGQCAMFQGMEFGVCME